MNKEVLEAQWLQVKGIIKEKFGNLTDDDIRQIDGRYDQLVARLQQRYGYSKEEAEEELRKWVLVKDPGTFSRDKPFVKPAARSEDSFSAKRSEGGTSSLLNWLIVAGVAALLLLTYFANEGMKTTPTQPNKTSEDMAIVSETPADQAMSQGIRRSLAADQSLAPDLNNIQIMSSNGAVTVTGTVATTQERDAILKVIQNSNGVTQINNHLEIR